MMDEIQSKIYDIRKILIDLQEFPQTYDTMLKECRNIGTYQTILRRKLNVLFRMGMVYKCQIPGTRFGKVLFFAKDKKYRILVEDLRIGVDVFYFFDFKPMTKKYIMVPKTYRLDGYDWKDVGQKVFFEGNVLKFI